MTTSYSRHILIVAFVLAVLAFTPLVTLAGGGGSGVRTNTTTGQFDSAPLTNNNNNQGAACAADAKMCPDGSFVGRVGQSCQFAACPTGTSTATSTPSDSNAVCLQDAKICPNGTSVGRVAPSCNFAACPTTVNAPASDAISCPQDAKICPDGTAVGRVAPSCNFAACPTGLPGSDTNGTPGAVGDSGTYIPPLFGGGGNTSGSGMTYDSGTVSNTGNNSGAGNNSAFCPLDAKMCPGGSFVGRVGPSCQFAACPTSTSTSTSTPSDSNVCPMDAKMCPGGSYVGRTGPSCTFAACPAAATSSTPGSDSGVTSNWQWPTFAFSGASNQNNRRTDSGVSNTLSSALGAVVSSVATAINPAFNMFSNAAEFGYDSVASSNQNTSTPLFVNFGAITMPTFDNGSVSNRPRSTSTLQTLLDRIYRRNQATSTDPTNIPGAIGDGMFGGGTKPNKTNTVAFEVKVMAVNGDIISNWATSTTATVPTGGQLQFRWTASDYAQCLPFLNDGGQYALKAKNRIMTIGNTETEGYNVPEVTGVYRIECGGQKNGESGVDERSVSVTGAGTVAPPLFGDGTVSNTDPSNTSGVCAMDAKVCPDGSYVSRTGPSCTFAACPSSNVDMSQIDTFMECANAGYPVAESNPPTCRLPDGRMFTGATYVVDPPVGGVCAQDAKRCSDGSYVTRTGPNCSFAACPTTTNQSGAFDGTLTQ